MNELIPINTNEKNEPCVSGRTLHEFLGVETPYTQWFDRMTEYGFAESIDFGVINIFVNDDTAFGGQRKLTDHVISLDMAKELAMIQRTEKGKQARQYFIAIEKEYNSPEKLMARALHIADLELKTVRAQLQEQAPKVLFADAVSASHTSVLVGELAKLISQNGYEIGQNRLFQWLRNKGYLMKAGASRNLPTQRAMEQGLFEIAERSITDANGSNRITRTAKVTGKGQIYFINKFLNKQLAIATGNTDKY